MSKLMNTSLVRVCLLTAVVIIAGCTIKGDDEAIRRQNAGVTIECKDVRDGERFSFRGEDVSNFRSSVVGGDDCFTAKTNDGTTRQLCRSHEQWLKCAKTAILKDQPK